MAKRPRGPDRPVDEALRRAFKAVEDKPVPKDVADHLDRLTAPTPRPDQRS